MRVRVIHIWIPSVISLGLAAYLSLNYKTVESVFFTTLSLALLACTKWADA